MATKKTVIVHNIKNKLFRQIHVDGAHGGLTPNGYINLNFYSQRGAIPTGTEFEIDENGVTKKLRDLEDSKSGVVREFEVGIYMDINACENLVTFLQDRIKELTQIQSQKK